jgi:hypothetical protein
MAATRDDVNRWIATANAHGSKFILSVCDTFDYEDYPVYCEDIKELKEEYKEHHGVNMQRVNEIIRINDDGSVDENLTILNF